MAASIASWKPPNALVSHSPQTMTAAADVDNLASRDESPISSGQTLCRNRYSPRLEAARTAARGGCLSVLSPYVIGKRAFGGERGESCRKRQACCAANGV